VYVTVPVYAPAGCELVALTAYHTVVTSELAVVEVFLIVDADPVAGTPAHVDELEPLFVSAEYAVVPKPPTFTILYPHLLLASAVGDACVPVCAAIELPPLVRLVVASLSASVNVYPVVLFVLTDTLSLALLTTPPEVGVRPIATEPLLDILIVAATVALTVVLEVDVAADTRAGAAITNDSEKRPATVPVTTLLLAPIITSFY
jgi:hypothetical protein